MMTARDWFEKARKENFAIGAFNVDSLEIFKGICLGAKNKKSPVMVEFSPGEVSYFGLKDIVDMVINAREEYKIPILLNLDHGKPAELVKQAIEQPGFDDIHFDGSDLDFGENIHETREIVSKAHSKGLLVEGETDKIAGSSEVHEEEVNIEALKGLYTDVKRATRFVQETKVDIYAPFFGNLHGTFPTQPDLDMGLITNLAQALGETFLSLHGASGIPAVQVKQAIKVGKIVKVNINTELRIAYRDALAAQIEKEPPQYKVYDYSDEIVLTVAAVVEDKIDVLGSGGRV